MMKLQAPSSLCIILLKYLLYLSVHLRICIDVYGETITGL